MRLDKFYRERFMPHEEAEELAEILNAEDCGWNYKAREVTPALSKIEVYDAKGEYLGIL